jgi:hypothetical protein
VATATTEDAGGPGSGDTDSEELSVVGWLDRSAPRATSGHALGESSFDDGHAASMGFGFAKTSHLFSSVSNACSLNKGYRGSQRPLAPPHSRS